TINPTTAIRNLLDPPGGIFSRWCYRTAARATQYRHASLHSRWTAGALLSGWNGYCACVSDAEIVHIGIGDARCEQSACRTGGDRAGASTFGHLACARICAKSNDQAL